MRFCEGHGNVTGRRVDRGQRSETVRRTNLSALVRALHAEGSLSRTELGERTGLTRSAIARLVGVEIGRAVIADGHQIGVSIAVHVAHLDLGPATVPLRGFQTDGGLDVAQTGGRGASDSPGRSNQCQAQQHGEQAGGFDTASHSG